MFANRPKPTARHIVASRLVEGAAVTCCAKPAVARFDYGKPARPMVNRVCTNCLTHWFGKPSAVKKYTHAEWDTWINRAVQS